MILTEVLSHFGTAVFAASGVLAAVRRGFDPVGVLVLATVTAIGGGTVRDLLLDRPVFWVTDTAPLVSIFIAVILTLIYTRFFKAHIKLLLLADAFGLAFFSINGARIAESLDMHPLIIVVMGTITGAAGGVMRDMLCAETPVIFRQTELYASAAIAGCGLYLVAQTIGMQGHWAVLIGMVTILGLRLAAIRWSVKLPVFKDHA